MEWLHTDSFQRALKISDDKFIVVETYLFHNEVIDKSYAYFIENEVNISIYKEEELEKYAKGYYPKGLKEIIDLYGEDWKLIMAEIISEQREVYDEDMGDPLEYEDETELGRLLNAFIKNLNYI